MELKMNKKGQLGNLTGIVFVLVIVGVLVVTGFLILGSFSEQVDDKLVTIGNETFTNITDGASQQVAFANNSEDADNLGFNSFTLTAIAATAGNASTQDALGNFTIGDGVVSNGTSSTNGTFQFIDGFDTGNWNGSSFEVSYTFKKGEAAYQGIEKSIDAFETIPDLLPLIVLIAMIVIILFLVFTIPGASRSASA